MPREQQLGGGSRVDADWLDIEFTRGERQLLARCGDFTQADFAFLQESVERAHHYFILGSRVRLGNGDVQVLDQTLFGVVRRVDQTGMADEVSSALVFFDGVHDDVRFLALRPAILPIVKSNAVNALSIGHSLAEKFEAAAFFDFRDALYVAINRNAAQVEIEGKQPLTPFNQPVLKPDHAGYGEGAARRRQSSLLQRLRHGSYGGVIHQGGVVNGYVQLLLQGAHFLARI